MLKIRQLQIEGFEKVIEAECEETHLHTFIAIHNTTLGPALGGIRFYPYKTRDAALEDVLKLARTMSYKSALVKDGLGGGKSVIIGDPSLLKSTALLTQFGKLLNTLKGQYIGAEDVGTNEEDMAVIRQESPYVSATPSLKSSGDPSRFTAWGIFLGLQAVARFLWNDASLKGKKVAIQGLGKVGTRLAEFLFWEGAELYVTDIHPQKMDAVTHDYGAHALDADEILSFPCDILSPCAMGEVINAHIIPRLKCRAIAGSANNQLATPQDGTELFKRGILYAPDYVINAGGIINAAAEFEPEGYRPLKARERTLEIYPTLLKLFEDGAKQNKPPFEVADAWAEYNILHGIGQRATPIRFEN